MASHGPSIKELIQLLTPLFGIIAAVWILRLLLGYMSAPGWLLQVFSVSIVVPICVILMTVLIHVRRFGDYGSVVASSFLLVGWSQLLIVLTIIFAVLTGIENVYTRPEFSMMNDPNHVRHVIGHLTFGVAVEGLIASGMASLIFYMLRRTTPRRKSDDLN